MSSSAEQKIRDEVVNWCRENVPQGRIIHELNCGPNRIDVACITTDQIIAFEIKSEKDTLKRLMPQVKQFRSACHGVVTVAHAKFWKERINGHNGRITIKETDALAAAQKYSDIWVYPKRYNRVIWEISPSRHKHPDTRQMLSLLWAEELRQINRNYKFITKGINTIPASRLRPLFWERLTGVQITKAVCTALRAREFAKADAPQILTALESAL